MKKILPLLAAAALLALPSCRFIRISDELKEQIKENSNINVNGDADGERITASTKLITQELTPGEFHALTCNLPGDVTYTPGDCAVTLNGPDNVLPHISVTNENGTLVIKSDGVNFRNFKNFNVLISSPVLEEAVFNGAVDFEAPKGISALDFKAIVNGAGEVDIDGLKCGKADIILNGAGEAEISWIDCDALTVQINGAGDAEVSGRAGRADLSISGAGEINARELKCQQVESKVRGIGSIKQPQ